MLKRDSSCGLCAYKFIRGNFHISSDVRWTANGNLDVVNFSARNLSPLFCGANEIEIFYLSLDTWKNFLHLPLWFIASSFKSNWISCTFETTSNVTCRHYFYFRYFLSSSSHQRSLNFLLYLDSRGILHFMMMIIIIFIMLLLML